MKIYYYIDQKGKKLGSPSFKLAQDKARFAGITKLEACDIAEFDGILIGKKN